MKKIISLTLIFLVFAGCATTAVNTTSPDETNTTTETAQYNTTTSIETTGNAQNEENLEDILYALARRNHVLATQVFLGEGLPFVSPPDGRLVEPVEVNSEMFPTFQDLVDFTESTLVATEAYRWLFEFGGPGNPKYFEQDGRFMWNPIWDGAMGYRTNWDEMTVAIISQAEDEILFDINVLLWDLDEWEEVRFVPGVVEARAVLENGVWLLDEMVF